MVAIDCIQDVHALLGECARWEPDAQRLYWTDIDGRRLWSVGIAGDAPASVELPYKVGAFALRASGGMLLATDAGLYAGDPFAAPDKLALVCPYPEPEVQLDGGRFNDGCCDPAGRFIVGTLDPQKQGRANAYSFEGDASIARKVLTGFSTFNGLAFTPSGDEAWFTDTPQRKVWRASYDVDSGTFGERELVIQFPEDALARPDGAGFDTDGNYWVAMFEGGCVHCVSPAGEVMQSHGIPATFTTMASFAGPRLAQLAVTCAGRDDAQERNRHPQAGGLFVIDGLGARGAPVAKYAG